MLVFLVPLSFTLGLVLGQGESFVLGDISGVIVPGMVSRVPIVEVLRHFVEGVGWLGILWWVVIRLGALWGVVICLLCKAILVDHHLLLVLYVKQHF